MGQTPCEAIIIKVAGAQTPATFLLSAVEEDLAAILFRTHREVNPIRRASSLQDQFVELPFRAIGDVEQDACHPDHLLRPVTMYIHRTSRQMIAPFRSLTLHIHLLTPIPAVDNHGQFLSRPITRARPQR